MTYCENVCVQIVANINVKIANFSPRIKFKSFYYVSIKCAKIVINMTRNIHHRLYMQKVCLKIRNIKAQFYVTLYTFVKVKHKLFNYSYKVL